MTNQTAYPLSWPAGWPRTKPHTRESAPFWKNTTRSGSSSTWRTPRSMEDAAKEILNQLAMMGVGDCVISTNTELRADGLPYSNRRTPEDPGAAVYFTLKKIPTALASDRWDRVEDNLWAIAKHLEAMRGQARWGVGSREQAFAGYQALNAPGESSAPTWYAVLGVKESATFEEARDAYRHEAHLVHPDRPGGSHEKMARLNESWDQARRHFGK